VPFFPLEKGLSIYRIHPNHKTAVGGKIRQKELMYIYSIYNPYYKALYEKVIDEKLIPLSKKYRMIYKLFKLLKCNSSYGSILKFIKAKKYKEYNFDDINHIKGML